MSFARHKKSMEKKTARRSVPASTSARGAAAPHDSSTVVHSILQGFPVSFGQDGNRSQNIIVCVVCVWVARFSPVVPKVW